MLKDWWLESQDQDNLIEKKWKKQHDLTWVNLSKLTILILRPRYPIETKSKHIIKLNSQSTKYWIIKLKKEHKNDQVNSLNIISESLGWDNLIKNKQKQIMKLNSQSIQY
jgi:hypothetical protein